MSSYRIIQNFDANSQPFLQYTERIELHFLANQVTDGGRIKNIIVTLIELSVYSILRSLFESLSLVGKYRNCC